MQVLTKSRVTLVTVGALIVALASGCYDEPCGSSGGESIDCELDIPTPYAEASPTGEPDLDETPFVTPLPDEDWDDDGFSASDGDCDDLDGTVYPGAEEVPYDGVDQDCSGSDLVDVDGDGVEGGPDGADCDDQDGTIYPGAEEIPYDGVDQDCTGADQADLDGDGYAGEEAGGTDCDDQDPTVHPDAEETADGRDEDCDGVVDNGVDTEPGDDLSGDEEDTDCTHSDADCGDDQTGPCDDDEQPCEENDGPCGEDEDHSDWNDSGAFGPGGLDFGSGCDCTVAPDAPASSGWLSFLLLTGPLVVWRRRR